MSILTRYLLRSYLPVFLLCLGVFLSVLLMNYFLRLFNLAVMKGISPAWILFCFARLLPYFLSLAIPMAFVVALLLTLAQFSETGEEMAFRSAGFSFREILAPYLALAAGLSLLLVYINHKASPEAFHSFRDSYSAAVDRVARVSIEPRTLTHMGDWKMYCDAADAATGNLGGVRLVKGRGTYKRLRVSAPRGLMRLEKGRGIHLELYDGAMLWPNDDPASSTSATFVRYHLFTPFVDYKKVHRDPDLQELNTFRLRERLRDASLAPSKRREYATEEALRSAGAAAPFVLFWVACPLGLRGGRRSRAVSFALSLGVMFAYYALLAVGVGLGRRNLAWSPWGPWLPDAASLAAGAALWWARMRE